MGGSLKYIDFQMGDSELRFYGILGGTTTAPTTTDLPTAGGGFHSVCIWEETDTNIWTWFVNDAGTIRQIS